jgi:hypothetical protein
MIVFLFPVLFSSIPAKPALFMAHIKRMPFHHFRRFPEKEVCRARAIIVPEGDACDKKFS